MEDWKILVLKHDKGSEYIRDFFKKIWLDGIITKNIDNTWWLEHKEYNAENIKKTVGDLEGRILTLYGNGCYHHYTYGLCYAIAHEKSDNYMYVHIDHHTDSKNHDNGIIKCGSFVENITEEPEANDVLLIGASQGVNPQERTVIRQKDLVSKRSREILRKELKKKLQKDIYVSIDLDILKHEEVSTDYSQGILELKHLLDVLDVLNEEKNIISADILGYNGHTCPPGYPVSLMTYAILAAKITGKETKGLEELREQFKNKRFDKAYFDEEELKLMEEELKNFKKVTKELRI